MKLSIIIPIYNVESYLDKTLKSVLEQTYTDFELILVDDGSTDKSGEICDEYAKKDRRIKVVHKSNGGVSSARNVGIKQAQGDFIGFVDSDDIISEVMYEGMINAADKYNADIVQCTHVRDVKQLNHDTEAKNAEVYDTVDALNQLYIRYYTNCFALWSKVYKREVFSDIKFPEGRVFEDDEIIPHLIYKAKRVVMIDNLWYCYLKRENSIITGVKVEDLYALTDTLQRRMEFFKDIDEDLYLKSVRHFMHYLKIKYANCYNGVEGLTEDQERYFREYLMRNKRIFSKVCHRYDRIYLVLLRINNKVINSWIGKNDFEPIQNIVRKIKGIK